MPPFQSWATWARSEIAEKRSVEPIELWISGERIGDDAQLPIEQQEQQAIVNLLDLQMDKIDRLLEKVALSIDRLREYRTALISAAVTGKIDVREVVA